MYILTRPTIFLEEWYNTCRSHFNIKIIYKTYVQTIIRPLCFFERVDGMEGVFLERGAGLGGGMRGWGGGGHTIP